MGQRFSILGSLVLHAASSSQPSLVDHLDIALSLGLEPYKMLEQAGLPRSCLRTSDIRISAHAAAELLEASGSAAGGGGRFRQGTAAGSKSCTVWSVGPAQ